MLAVNLSRSLLILWTLGIGYVSFTPSPERDFPLYLSLGELTLHFIAFFVLFLLAYLSFPQKEGSLGRQLAIPFLFTFAVALGKELAQQFIPNRFFALQDLLIDCLSAGFAAFLISGWKWGKDSR